jgi:hypothetical protein
MSDERFIREERIRQLEHVTSHGGAADGTRCLI